MTTLLQAVRPGIALAALAAVAASAIAQETPAPAGPVLTQPASEPKAAPAKAEGDAPSRPKDGAKAKRTEKSANSGSGDRKSGSRAKTEPAGTPFASCEEPQNDNGLRVIIMTPAASSVRLAIYDRGGRLIEKDLFTPGKGDAALGYARILWGTRNTPPERLQKGAFLIKTQQKGRYMEGTLLADGGDGSFMIRSAHLGKPEPDARRWTLRLGGDRTLSCRVGAG